MGKRSPRQQRRENEITDSSPNTPPFWVERRLLPQPTRRWRRRRRYMQISRARRAAAATAVAEVRPHTAIIIIIIEPERRARAAPRLPNRLPSRLGRAESSGGGGRGNGEEGDGGNVLFDVASVFRKQKGRIFFAFGSFWTRFSARRSR